MYWLHHIGRSFWSIREFEKEVRKYGANSEISRQCGVDFGISRRISTRTLKAMRAGDTVLLAHWDGKKSIVFGKFTLTSVYFSKSGILDELKAQNAAVPFHGTGGIQIKRKCGSYYIQFISKLQAPLNQIAAVAERLGDKLMIGGPYERIRPKVILKDVPHRMGFRAFNWDLAMSSVDKKNAKGEPVLRGQFYVDHESMRILGALMGEEPACNMVFIAGYTPSKP